MVLKQHLAPDSKSWFHLLLLIGLIMVCTGCKNASSVWIYIDNQNDAAVGITVGGEELPLVKGKEHLITMVHPGNQEIYLKMEGTGKVDSIKINLNADKKYVLNPFQAMSYYLGTIAYSKYRSPSNFNRSDEKLINKMIFPVDVDYLLEEPPSTIKDWGNKLSATRKYLRRETDPSPHGPSQEELADFLRVNKDLFSSESTGTTAKEKVNDSELSPSIDSGKMTKPTITEQQKTILQLIANAKLENALRIQFGKSADLTRHLETLKAAEATYLADPPKNFEDYSVALSKVSLEILKSVSGIKPVSFDKAGCLHLLSENKIEEATKILIDAGHEMGAHQQLRYTLWRNEVEAGRIPETPTMYIRNRVREAIKESIQTGWMEY